MLLGSSLAAGWRWDGSPWVEKTVVRQQAGTLASRLLWWAMRKRRTDCIKVEVAAGKIERSRCVHSVLRSRDQQGLVSGGEGRRRKRS